ncbi:MAG: M16 family metallopeptidase, partial [Halanaerobium sp.]
MFKRKTIFIISLLLISVIFIPTVRAETELSNELFYELIKTKNEKPEIEIPDYEKVELKNGMVVYLVKNDEYPVVEVRGFIEGGRRQESSDLAGISDIMVKMMSTGTKNLDEEEYAKEKELSGIDLNFGVSNDTFKIDGSALSSETENLLSLLADSLKNPDFQASYLQRVLQEQQQYLAQSTVQADQLLNSHFFKNIYGNHPYSYAKNLDLKQSKLKTFNSQKLKDFYNNSIGPEKMVMAVVGEIDIEKARETIKDNFGDWEKQNIEIKKSEIDKTGYDQNKVIIVDKKDTDQAHMKLGYNFSGHDFENETEFLIGNRIFGQGGFSSRLMENIRSEKGYVYSIYSDVSYNKDGGVYYINTKVDPAKAVEVLKAVKDEMEIIKNGENKITKKEVEENINLYNGLL